MSKMTLNNIDRKMLEDTIISVCVADKNVSRNTSLKKVANQLKLDFDCVFKFYNTRNLAPVIRKLKQQTMDTSEIVAVSPFNINPSSHVINLDSTDSSNLSIEQQENNICKSGGKKAIDSDIVINMLTDYENSDMSVKEICDKYNVSSFTLYKYKKMMGVEKGEDMRKKNYHNKKRNTPHRKSIEELQKEYVTKTTTVSKIDEEPVNKNTEVEKIEKVIDDKKFIVINPNNKAGLCEEILTSVIPEGFSFNKRVREIDYAGLCADRHDMPIDNFIFNVLNESEMFDYETQYNHAVEWLKENVKTGTLYLYMTGMQCILAATIKACYDLGIGLTLLHRNAAKQIYEKQVVWENKAVVSEFDIACEFIRRKGVIYKTDTDINNEKFYTISVNKVCDKNDGFMETAYLCCSTMEQACSLLPQYITKINERRGDQKLCVFISECHIQDQRFIWDINLTKSFNFK